MSITKTAFILGILVSSSLFGAFEEITLANYPDADCVMADGISETVYRPDGTHVITDEQWTKVLTEKGRREESKIELRYNRRYGAGAIEFVSVIGVDGTERTIDVSATTKESTDNSSASANIYDPMARRLVCTIPGVKVGETIHYRTRKTMEKSRVENQFADISILEWQCPIVRQTVRVRAPAERPLKCIAIRKPLGNVTYTEEKQADGSTLHTWVAKDSPQAFPEPDMPPLYGELQHLRVSTATDWPELSRWYWNLCLPHLERTNAGITNKVNELVAGLPRDNAPETVLAKVNAIYKWVAQEIRYMGLTMEDTSPGYAPHDVSITFDNRYGVCRDKAGLLVAMLRQAGLDAFPVLIHTSSKMDAEVPLPYFNHAIVAVRAPGVGPANPDGFILMDPTDESSRDLMPAYLSDCSYLVARPEGEPLHTTPVIPAAANAVRVTSEGVLEKDGSVLLTANVGFTGYNDNMYRSVLLRRKPEERRQLFERIVRNAMAGAELLSFDLLPADLQDTAKPLQAKLLVRMPETLLRGETRAEFTPPLLSRQLGAANWLLEGSMSLARRRFPLVLASTALTEETLTIRLDGNVGAPLALPEDVTIEGPYEYRRRYAVKDGVFTAERRLAVNAVEFSPAAYEDLRENIKRVEATERKRPVFGKDDLAGANVRLRHVGRAYAFTSPTSWTATNTVVKEILTYDGKKSSSELAFSYNPTWEKIELVSAVVSNANGTVASVSEKERNVFDCGWASAAPRYPATKQLIVNLPSVEVGSTISYTTVTTVTNAPAAYYGTFYKDVFEPTDEIVTTIDGKTTVIRNPKLLKQEPMQPDGRVWRERETVSKGDFKTASARLLPATEVEPIDDWEAVTGKCLQSPEGEGEATAALLTIRNWMAKHIRVAGPSLYEVPLALQLTDPRTVLKERYATRLDYIRTMAALLKGAGYDTDIVFASMSAAKESWMAWEDLLSPWPNERAFASALCRVRVREGGFWGIGGTVKTYFIGTENEYTPLGATPYRNSLYLDPQTAVVDEEVVVTVPDEELAPKGERNYTINIRENGMADIAVEELTWGPGVGGFRKQYTEMLPEDRKRHYEELLGGISQAADATRDLMTDVESYPARRTFECVVPDYATVEGDTITVSLPEIGAQLVPLTGSVREAPIAFATTDPFSLRLEVTFPEGYTEIEHLAKDFTVFVPSADYVREYYFYTMLDEKETRLTVYLGRCRAEARASSADKSYFEYLKSMNRQATSRATRTVTVRRAKR